MKLAIYIPSFAGGGGQKAAVQIANFLAENGESVDLIAGNAAGPFLGDVSPHVNIVNLNQPRVSRNFPRLLSCLKRSRPDVLFSFQTRTNIFAIIAKMLFSKLVVVIREGNTPSLNLRKSPLLSDRAVFRLLPAFYRRADAIVAISHGVANDLRQLLGPLDISVIYNPCVSTELLARSKATVNHRWLDDPHQIVLISVARLNIQKDHATLLRALARVRKQIDAKLLILGIGSEEGRLKQLAAELGVAAHVDFTGFIENPYPYMRAADLFVQSSRWEGFGIALVEAMALGTPVVSTDCPSGPREILADGKFGELVDPQDPENLAKVILETLKNPLPAERLSERAQIFSVEESAAAYLKLARQLLAESTINQ